LATERKSDDVLLFVDRVKPCLWDHPSPMEKASQIRSATRMVRKSIGEMIPENIWTRIETVAISVSGMVHTRKDRMPKKSNQKE
jgi:hypothetical protein